jgi:acetylornithine deacetylase/succinyl-diaminopimelate desuccinylase-like protein
VSIHAQSGPNDARAREIYKELVEINTTDTPAGNVTRAAEAVAARLRAAGFPETDIHVLGPDPRKHNVVARYHGSGAKRPRLLLAHLDVVEAKKEDWSFDPFTFLEKDGFFYGRGTSDDKAMASILTANLIRLKQENYRPDRDLILALTADEEGGDFNGVDWLVKNHKDLIDAEFAINEGGGGNMRKGKYLTNEVQASEKVFQNFRLEVTNPGGHSSLPRPDNAIYDLADALEKLRTYRFQPMQNDVSRAYFEERAKQEGSSQLGQQIRAWLANPKDDKAADAIEANPLEVGLTRTRCVATMLSGGHADNALPQSATATVNCRIFPGVQPVAVQAELQKLVGPNVEVKADPNYVGQPTPASPLRPDVLKAVTSAIQKFHGPDMHVFPMMSTGASDGSFFRAQGIPVYDIDGSWGISPDDERAHGLDERTPVRSMYDDVLYWEMLFKALAS